MSQLIVLIPVALFLGAMSLLAFLWALRSGQYDDVEGAGARILLDAGDEGPAPEAPRDLPVDHRQSGHR